MIAPPPDAPQDIQKDTIGVRWIVGALAILIAAYFMASLIPADKKIRIETNTENLPATP